MPESVEAGAHPAGFRTEAHRQPAAVARSPDADLDPAFIDAVRTTAWNETRLGGRFGSLQARDLRLNPAGAVFLRPA
ncbi:MAG: hypothetical protein OXP09_11765 [Gammaproteobacteria bacterium]|nr:hypothetical protein [Gammaproteobacteria bacterium]